MNLSNMLNPNDDSSNRELEELFASTEAAKVIPHGDYKATLIQGSLTESIKKGTPGYRMTWEISEGEFTGQRVFQTIWLTANSMAYAKRDLEKLGFTTLDQLKNPIAEQILASIRVAHQISDDGEERNEVKSFVVMERVPKKPDPFAPQDKGVAD